MFILIPSLLIATSLAVVGKIIYRKIPKDLSQWDEALSQENFGPTFYQKALAITSFKSQQIFLSFSTKFFHKVRLASLKTDNFSGKLLQKIHVYKKEFQQENNQPQEIAMLTLAQEDAIKPEDNLEVQSQNTINTINEDDGIVRVKKIVPQEIISKENILPVAPAQKMEKSFESQEQQLINQLTYNPKDVSVYKKLGWLYLDVNKAHQARQAFQTAIKLGSRDRIILAKLSEMEEKLGARLNQPILKQKNVSRPRTHRTNRPSLKI